MTLINYGRWILLVLIWFAVVSLLQYPIRKRRLLPLRIVLVFAKLLLGTGLAYMCMVTNIGYSFWGSYAMASLYVVMFGDLIGDILSMPFVLKDRDDTRPALQMVICGVCTVLFLIYGTVNMQTVTANCFTINSDKLTESHKVVFLADLHVGSSQSARTIEKSIEKIKAEEPDLVLLGGDIVDEYTTRDEMEQVFLLIGSIDAPKYFIYGNHDRQPYQHLCGGYRYTPEELDRALEVAGINVLKDEWVKVDDDLVILGREDYTSPDRKTPDKIPARPAGSFVLMLDHDPYQTEEIIESGADLQLSGHSHAGQLFPLQWLYRAAGYDAYGFFKHGDTTLYVSSGISGWCFPFRSEEKCHYEVITLEP